MDFTQDLANNIAQQAGVLEKAIIKIEPKQTGDPTVDKPVKIAGAGKLPGVSSLDGNASKFSEFAKAAGSALLDSATNSIQSLAAKTLDLDMEEEKLKNAIKVQFNPASINFDASAMHPSYKSSKQAAKENGDKPTRKEKVKNFFDKNDVQIRMTVDLIFDDVENNDAFLEEKLSPVSGELAQSLAKTATKLAGKKKIHSIRDKVMALTYLARSATVRRCTFNWGKICLPGLVEGVDVKYTMFNPKGEPIHAVVTFSMLLVPDSAHTSEWLEVYKEAFGMGTGLIKAGDRGTIGNAMGSVGNIINI